MPPQKTDHSPAQDAWVLQSNTAKTSVLSMGLILVGCLFILLTKDKVAGMRVWSDLMAAYYLGVLLFVLGLAALLFNENIEITVEPSAQRMLVQSRDLWASSQKIIAFKEVAGISVQKIRSKGDRANFYHLQIQLKNGGVQRTGFWALNQPDVFAVAERLAQDIGCEPQLPWRIYPHNSKHYILASVGAILIYTVWYRLTTGQLCLAMWFGAAPIYITGASFFGILGALKYFPLKGDGTQ